MRRGCNFSMSYADISHKDTKKTEAGAGKFMADFRVGQPRTGQNRRYLTQ